jgi:anthranilate synthase component I
MQCINFGGVIVFNLTEESFIENRKRNIIFPVIMETYADEITPINIFYNLEGRNKCLLESATNEGGGGRYSFIGIDPFMKLKSSGRVVEIIRKDGTETLEEDVLSVLKRLMKMQYESGGHKLPFSGGAVGYIGYDVIRLYEKLPDNNPQEIEVPEAFLMFYSTVIAYDHYKHLLYIIYNVQPEEKVSYEDITQKLQLLNREIKAPAAIKGLEQAVKDKEENHNFTEEEYCEIVEKAKEYIRRGDIFQVVLSQRFKIKHKSHPFEVYRRLRSKNPSPYLFYIDFEDFQVVGSSPESLVSVHNKKVITNPIAGTRPRGRNEEEDERLKEELLKDEKERAEHVMLVDLGRNDIGKISEFGTVQVERFMEVDLYSHVMHIVSTVSGSLGKDYDCFDALKACLPAGTVSGAPKIRAMEIIDELENVRRGVYSGAAGYFSYSGDMDMCIAIRTIVFKDDTAYLQAGAGIVYDSNPRSEYLETLNKAKALKEVI